MTANETSILLMCSKNKACETLKQTVESLPYNIDICESIDEAMKLQSDSPRDIVIAEYELENYSGLEFLQDVFAQHKQSTRIIVGAHANEEKIIKAVIKGVACAEYLKKLDDYFIKEKLEDIIKIGKQILSLKIESVKTKDAKKLIKKIFGEDIGQLENVWQRYFEKYLLYLFFSYKKIIPKVELKNLDNLDKQYPDFIGVNHYDGVDIIEIKTHLKNILVWDNSHKNFAFSSEMSKAIIQTINYMDAITDDKIKKSKEKKDLLNYLNIDENLYRPRGIIIISSETKICKNKLTGDQEIRLKKDFTKLRNSIHNIQIFTFNEILEIAERYVENIKSNKK